VFAQGRARLDHIISYIHIPRFPVIVAGGSGAFYYFYIHFFSNIIFPYGKTYAVAAAIYRYRRDDHRGRGRRPRTRSPATTAAMVPCSRSVRFVGRRSSSTTTGGRTGRNPIAIVFPLQSGTLTWSEGKSV